jgi:hypothetical protein
MDFYYTLGGPQPKRVRLINSRAGDNCICSAQGETPPKNMGWLRSVGSIKLKVSFAEYRLFNRALLQKRPTILSILLTEATP